MQDNLKIQSLPKVRESQFELLRIVAQWCIVFYHLFMDYTIVLQSEHPIYAAIQIPLHIGVLLFVLISGYFGIRPTIKGFLKLVSLIVIYFIPLAIYEDISSNLGLMRVIKDFLIVSYPRYWFFRCYLFLFFLAPIINKYLDNITSKQRLYTLAVLGYISLWVGSSMGDPSLIGGKNVINFIFLYVIGNTLKVYKDKWKKISTKVIIAAYVIYNISIVVIFMHFYPSVLSTVIKMLTFPYCSPGLLINSIIIFILFGKLKIQSKVINYIAASVFTVYLIHYQRYIWKLIGCGANWITSVGDSPITVISLFAIYATLIYLACTCIDKIISPPLLNIVNRICDRFLKIQ